MTSASIPGDAKSRMERILLLQEQIDAIKADIRDIYAEEKAAGGDKTAMGAAISYIRKREKDGAALAEREAMADVYVSAYDAPRAHTHTREARSYADAKLVETVAAGVQTEIGRAALTVALDAMLAVDEIADPETGEIIETQESDPANERSSDDVIASDAGVLARAASASAEHASDESSRTNSNPQEPTSSPVIADKAVATPPPVATASTSRAAHVDDFDPARDMPSFLRRTDKGAMSGVEA